MLTILHISDLHFGPPYVEKVGEALLRKSKLLDYDVLVVSGDLTQRAKPEQFAAAREYLDRLPGEIKIVVPGNHDVPLYRIIERLRTPHLEYRRHISEDLNTVTRVEGATFVALDSTAPRTAITNGRISPEQLDFCREQFGQTSAEDAKIVVAHHHFAPAPDYEKDQTLPRAQRAMDCFLSLGVDMILGGHLHRAYIGNSLDIYPKSNRERGIVIVQSGTSTSRRGRGRERERNSLNVIKISSQMLRITHYMYYEDTGEFGPLSRHYFPRAGRRFIEGELGDPD